MKLLFALSFVVAVIGGGVATSTAQAHFLWHKKHMTLEAKVKYFKRSIGHENKAVVWLRRYRYNLRHEKRTLAAAHDTAGEIAWHKEARRWHTSLLARYSAKLQTRQEKHRARVRVASWPPHYQEWMCIHRYEGSWTDTGAPYYGGLQFGYSEWRTYGTPYTGVDTANLASPQDQMWAAERYYRDSGFYPWPQTARMCGLI